jgi:hypothetical protein
LGYIASEFAAAVVSAGCCCPQGKKCKFAHDLTVGSKGRLDLTRDLREVRDEEKTEGVCGTSRSC